MTGEWYDEKALLHSPYVKEKIAPGKYALRPENEKPTDVLYCYVCKMPCYEDDMGEICEIRGGELGYDQIGHCELYPDPELHIVDRSTYFLKEDTVMIPMNKLDLLQNTSRKERKGLFSHIHRKLRSKNPDKDNRYFDESKILNSIYVLGMNDEGQYIVNEKETAPNELPFDYTEDRYVNELIYDDLFYIDPDETVICDYVCGMNDYDVHKVERASMFNLEDKDALLLNKLNLMQNTSRKGRNGFLARIRTLFSKKGVGR